MSAPAVHADGIWKLFHRGERHDSLRDLIPALVRRGRGGNGSGATASDPQLLGTDGFWAVQDVSFDVQFGRALGIIGPNGAGKSTMLKLLTGILRPTKGEIRMRGRVASLIEVAAGFHPDLTGRENVYLQGAILGMSRRDVTRRLDSIVEFSGIEAFIDTPVKRYSSGMNARLGFAIAVHLEPDVLVIDEVLSVGDVAFQQKCVERMRAFKRDGVAIVFVSHNMQAIGELCDEAIVLKNSVRYHGTIGGAVTEYVALTGGLDPASGKGRGVQLESSMLTDFGGVEVDAVTPGERVQLRLALRITEPLREDVQYSMRVLRATDGFVAYDGAFRHHETGARPVGPGDLLQLRFEHALHLTRGQYFYEFNVLDYEGSGGFRLWVSPVATVRVDEQRTYSGIADLDVAARAVAVPIETRDEVLAASVG